MQTYTGIDGRRYREPVRIASITIVRAEGPCDLCGREQHAGSWAEANAILRLNSSTAPETGGYDKHDFVITFADGYRYSGRYDLKHWKRETPDLAKHCRQFLNWIANEPRAADLFGAADIESAREIMRSHDWQQAEPTPA